jgi:hypothetical protein
MIDRCGGGPGIVAPLCRLGIGFFRKCRKGILNLLGLL